MGLIRFISEDVAYVIAGFAVLWCGIFLLTYSRSRVAHQRLYKHLRELRERLELKSTDSEAAVWASVQRVVEHEDRLVIGRIIERLKSANDDVSEADIKRCDRRWDFLRTVIEVFPILGILGTVSSMAIAADSHADDGAGSARIASVMNSFGDAMYSTIAGLLCAVFAIAMFGFVARKVDQWLSEVRDFERLVGDAEHVYERGVIAETSPDGA